MNEGMTETSIIEKVLGLDPEKFICDCTSYIPEFTDEEYERFAKKVYNVAREMCDELLSNIHVQIIPHDERGYVFSSEDWKDSLIEIFKAIVNEGMFETGTPEEFVRWSSSNDYEDAVINHLHYLRYHPEIECGKSLEELFYEEFNKRHNNL